MNTLQTLQEAFNHLNRGDIAAATSLFNLILQREPQNTEALNGRGLMFLQQSLLPQALVDFRQSLLINPQQPFSQKMQAIVLGAMGCFDESMRAFGVAVDLAPNDPEIYFNRAVFLTQGGQTEKALSDLDNAIRLHNSYPEARSNRAMLFVQLGNFSGAYKDLDFLVGKLPGNADLWVALGFVSYKLGMHNEAMAYNARALKLLPNHADALLNSSSVMLEMGNYAAALEWAIKAYEVSPTRADISYARAQALMALSQLDQAIAAYTFAVELRPEYTDAWIGRGLARAQLRDFDAAIKDYDRALILRPDHKEALLNKSVALEKSGKKSDALACYEHLLSIDQYNALALYNAAGVLTELKKFNDAIKLYAQVVLLKPDIRWMLGNYLFLLANVCVWEGLSSREQELFYKIKSGELVSTPFSLLSSTAGLDLKKKCAEIYTLQKYKSNQTRIVKNCQSAKSPQDKLVIAYISSDFYNHATSLLMAELFELHDRSRFHVIGISYGDSVDDEMRQRVLKGFDRFIDVNALADSEANDLLQELNIDIAIDLKGHTKDSRLGIFSRRLAPVHIHYLGYPGTLGAEFIDYLIADRTLVPESEQQFYTEKIIYLPDSYQVNDRLRQIALSCDSRREHGLPDTGFVFCCFNNNWKITPDLFDIWMRLLHRVPDSVLWLLEDNNVASENLKQEAKTRGVAADRLVFAKRMTLEKHLARHRYADLFLDTWYCNAHTTASDALWAGLPMITKLGETFAGRVGGSLLRAVGLEELVVNTTEAYEALAYNLATDREKLAEIRQRLGENRLKAPLFDTPRFTRNIESAYEAVWARYEAGLQPDHIYI